MSSSSCAGPGAAGLEAAAVCTLLGANWPVCQTLGPHGLRLQADGVCSSESFFLGLLAAFGTRGDPGRVRGSKSKDMGLPDGNISPELPLLKQPRKRKA